MKVAEARSLLDPFPQQMPPIPGRIIPMLFDERGRMVRRFPGPSQSSRAAVLILIYPDAHDEAHIVLTERAPGEHRHAGQISLPGGALEPTDESPVAAALREAAEEVGLDVVQAGVHVVGVLPAFDVRVSGFLVDPVVAFADRAPLLKADGHEVAEIIAAPLSAFLPDAYIETVDAETDGLRLHYGGYRIGRHHVWGATAMMLARLGAYLADAGR